VKITRDVLVVLFSAIFMAIALSTDMIGKGKPFLTNFLVSLVVYVFARILGYIFGR
jgi:hypothetical protein